MTLIVVAALVLLAVAVSAVVLAVRAISNGSHSTELARPVHFRPVLAQYSAPCKADDLPAGPTAPRHCYRLGGGFTVTAVESVEVIKLQPGYAVDLSLRDADATKFAHLTARLSHRSVPRNQLAVVVGNKLVVAPTVIDRITGGEVQISGNYTEQQAQRLRHRILG